MLLDKNDEKLRNTIIRTGQFKEIARDILSKDREFRKYGRNIDTGGAIKRALENAYKLGLQHAKLPAQEEDEMEHDDQDFVNWNVIPSRSRDAFSSMMQHHLIVLEVPNTPFSKVPTQWAMYFVIGDEASLLKTVSKSTMLQLIKLGLVRETSVVGKNALIPTALGIDSWNNSISSGLNPGGDYYKLQSE